MLNELQYFLFVLFLSSRRLLLIEYVLQFFVSSADILPRELTSGFSSLLECASVECLRLCLVSVDTGTFIRCHSSSASRCRFLGCFCVLIAHCLLGSGRSGVGKVRTTCQTRPARELRRSSPRQLVSFNIKVILNLAHVLPAAKRTKR